MKISNILSDNLIKKFKFTASASELQTLYDQELQKYGAKARIPGFRPGKTPRAILVQRYGKDAWEESWNQLLEESVQSLYKEHKFRDAITPHLNIISQDEGKDFECEITFEVLPEIVLKDFGTIKLELLNVSISDVDVDKRLKRMLTEHERYQVPGSPRSAQKKDLISVKWFGKTIDGDKIDMPENYQMLLGKEKEDSPFFPVLKTLYGKNVGDSFTVEIKFPVDKTDSSALSGKKATIHVDVLKIEEPLVFELNDVFAKEFGHDDLEKLRTAVRSDVEFEGKKIAHLYMKRNLLDTLDAQYDFDLPPTVVENEFKAIWDQLNREFTEARENGELEEDEQDLGKSDADLQKEYKAIAIRRVRLGLLISHLADLNKLKVEEEEIKMAIWQEAMRYPDQIEDVIKYYVNNKKALQGLIAPLMEEKVVNFVMNNVNVTNRDVDFETLKKVVRGVIPTPYDEEVEDLSQETETKSKKAASAKVIKGEKVSNEKKVLEEDDSQTVSKKSSKSTVAK